MLYGRIRKNTFRRLRKYIPMYRKATGRTGGRRARSNRIFRKFISRRAIRPELKWIVLNDINRAVAPSTTYTSNLTPNVFDRGVNVGQVIGNHINFVKFNTRLVIRNNSSTTSPAVAPSIQSQLVRFVIWTPRVDYQIATTYMTNNLSLWNHIDHTQITIHRDVILKLSPPYMAEATTNDIAACPFGYKTYKGFDLKFPRKVMVTVQNAGITNIDEDKDIAFYTVVSDLDISYNIETKLYYFDS